MADDDSQSICQLCENTRLITFGGRHRDTARARRCDCLERCPECDGSGFAFTTDAHGYRFVSDCTCRKVDRKVRIFNQARLPARYANASMHDFSRLALRGTAGARHQSTTLAATQAAMRFMTTFKPGCRGLLLHGPAGSGKTHLMVATLRHLVLNLGIQVRFVEFMHLLSDLRATFDGKGRAYDVMEPLVTVPVLAIDELGKGRRSDWERDVLDELISKRYNARHTTLFTTNYKVGEPPAVGSAEPQPSGAWRYLNERIGERSYSRLKEMCDPYLIEGDDLRDHRPGG